MLQFIERPNLKGARMLLGFSGWMDGGEVSTGTVEWLAHACRARPIAHIEPENYYIYNVPGSMEISALFRPKTRIEDGLIVSFDEPVNTFYCDERRRLVLFEGKEPNLHWNTFAECLFTVMSECDVSRVYFVGSVAGLVPHTRLPRFFSSVSHESLRALVQKHGISPADYEGPASFVTYLLTRASQRGIEMMTVVAQVPAYVQGKNVKCLRASIGKVAKLMDLTIDLDELDALSEEFEAGLNEIVESRPELKEHIERLEENYDKEVIDAQEADLKAWLERQGIRLD